MSYLPKVRIVDVRYGAQSPYMKTVHIVGWEDQYGNPMKKPMPGPTPSADLAIDDPTTTSGETLLGSQLTGTLATFTGGEEPVVVVSRWERSDDGVVFTGITDWQQVHQLTYTTIADDNQKYIRFATKAEDAREMIAISTGNAIGPMIPAPITITTATKLSNGTFVNPANVYSFETITPVSAIYAGGFGPLELRYRLQEDTGSGWVAVGGWSGGNPSYDVSQSSPTEQLRWQTRATDSVGQTKVSNSPATTVGVATTIGTLSIAPPQTQADPGATVTFDALISGDASPLYTWNIRSGPGQIISPTNIGQQIEVKLNDDATTGQSVVVQVTAVDNSSSDNPQSTTSIIISN